MFFVILLGLAIPLPLALYFLILYYLNSRAHPVLVSGSADFALLLFASSGFVIFGGPCVLAGFHEAAREYLLYGPLRGMNAYDWRFWISLWIGYVILVIGGSLWLLYRRRRATSIYNIEPADFRSVFADTLERLHLKWLRDGDQFFITLREPHSEAEAKQSAAAVAPGAPRLVAVRVDPFPALRHVGLYWRTGAQELRYEIERELDGALQNVRSGANPAAAWMFSLAGSLLALMFFTAAVIVMFLYFLGKAQPL